MHKDLPKQLSFFSLMIGFCLYSSASKAENYYDLDMQDLMNMEVSVTTKTEQTLSRRESPGIVTVITSDEILTSGARDLMDVLSLVQGFSFGVDVAGVVGLGVRGNWAHEGKALILLDGHEMNEVSFGTFSFGGHIPAENIERIEIIRGPGSAIYGGFAELGVVNIITHKGGFSNKPTISTGMGTRGDGLSQQNNHFAYRYKDEKIDWDISSVTGKSERSDAIYHDFYNGDYDMTHNSDINPELHQMRLSAYNFNFGVLIDNYHHQSQDLFSSIAPRPVTVSFPSHSYLANYQWKINEHASLKPAVHYRKQKAWDNNAANFATSDAFFADYGRDAEITRTEYELQGEFNQGRHLNLLAGYVQFKDIDSMRLTEYTSKAFFVQNLFKESWANVILGARIQDHNVAGSSLVPRVGLTKVINERLHFKWLYAEAFREPVSENFSVSLDPENEQISSEHTKITEIEVGYQPHEFWFLTANLFNIRMEDPIVYFFDENEASGDTYQNFEGFRTKGLEFEAKYKDSRKYMTFSGSFFQVTDNQVDQYAILDIDGNIIDEKQFLGMPPLKVILNGGFYLNSEWTLGASLIHYASKYAYTSVTLVDNEERLVPEKLDPTYIANINVVRKKFFDRYLTLSFGIENLLNDEHLLAQPYHDGYHAPLPEGGREFYVKIFYNHPALTH